MLMRNQEGHLCLEDLDGVVRLQFSKAVREYRLHQSLIWLLISSLDSFEWRILFRRMLCFDWRNVFRWRNNNCKCYWSPTLRKTGSNTVDWDAVDQVILWLSRQVPLWSCRLFRKGNYFCLRRCKFSLSTDGFILTCFFVQDRLHAQLMEHTQLTFFVLSDVWLDHPKTLFGLRKLFRSCIDSNWLPKLFIMCGNFASKGVSKGNPKSITAYQGADPVILNLSLLLISIIWKRGLWCTSRLNFLISTSWTYLSLCVCARAPRSMPFFNASPTSNFPFIYSTSGKIIQSRFFKQSLSY